MFCPGRLARLLQEPPWQEWVKPGMQPYLQFLVQGTESRSFEKAVVKRHLENFVSHKSEILKLADQVLPELEEVLVILAAAVCPTSPLTLDLDRDKVDMSFRYLRLLRNRYSTFDLVWELGLEEEYLKRLAGYIDDLYRSCGDTGEA